MKRPSPRDGSKGDSPYSDSNSLSRTVEQATEYIEMPHPFGHFHGKFALSMYDQIQNSLRAARTISDTNYFRDHATLFFEVTTLRDITHRYNCHMATILALDELLAAVKDDDDYDKVNIDYQRKIQELIEADVQDFKLTLPLGSHDLDLSVPIEQPHQDKIRIISKEYRDQKLSNLRVKLIESYRKYSSIIITPGSISDIRAQLQRWYQEFSIPNEITIEEYVRRQIEFSDSIENYRKVHLKPTLDNLAKLEKDFSQSLISYCQAGNYAEARLLFKGNSTLPVDSTDFDGATALHHAAGINHPLLVRLLLRNRANPKAKDKYGYTPLHYALRRTIESNNLNKFEDRNCIATIEILLTAGADIEDKADHNRTPLQTACVFGCFQGAIWLLSKGANIQTPEIISDSDKASTIKPPLTLAAENGHYDLVESLLLKGAAPLIDSSALSPMYYAIISCRIDIALKLIEYGLFLTDRDCETLKTIFARQADTSSQSLCLQYIMKIWFIKSGLNIRILLPAAFDVKIQEVIERMMKIHGPLQQHRRMQVLSMTRMYLSQLEPNPQGEVKKGLEADQGKPKIPYAENIAVHRSRSLSQVDLDRAGLSTPDSEFVQQSKN